MAEKSAFKDLFSNQAAQYAKYRPGYPEDLFKYLASLPESHSRVLDCGCGNGQASRGLVNYFDQIIAVDPSQEQINHAFDHPKIKYFVSPAEDLSFVEDRSVDLVTVATALHWFQLEKFYKEVNRVLKDGGWIVVWVYGVDKYNVDNQEVSQILEEFMSVFLHDYWAPENQLVRDRYQTIDFPFQEVQTPSILKQQEVNLKKIIGLLSSISATQNYIEKTGKNPLPDLEARLQEVWGPKETVSFSIPIHVRAGKKRVE